MFLNRIAAKALLTAALMTPLAAFAQESHYEAKRQVEARDAQHHNKAKIVGGSAIGGAVIGGLLGGPKGAVIGAGVGAGGGVLANKARKHHSIQHRQRYAHSHYNRY